MKGLLVIFFLIFSVSILSASSKINPEECKAILEEAVYTTNSMEDSRCLRCGWLRNHNGGCTNPNCHGYGPNKELK
jgi:hypothetical protein